MTEAYILAGVCCLALVPCGIVLLVDNIKADKWIKRMKERWNKK